MKPSAALIEAARQAGFEDHRDGRPFTYGAQAFRPGELLNAWADGWVSAKRLVPTDRHTPGPWQLSSVSPAALDGRGCRIACADQLPGQDVAETLANARLIAAAPCLLAACRETLAALHDPDADDHFTAARLEDILTDAIAKATAPQQ